MLRETDYQEVPDDERPAFVEEAYYSGARIGEAIDWCIARQDRELHCEVEGVLRSTGKDVRLRGRILKVKKSVLTRRIAVIVEEDMRRQKAGELEQVLTLGSDRT